MPALFLPILLILPSTLYHSVTYSIVFFPVRHVRRVRQGGRGERRRRRGGGGRRRPGRRRRPRGGRRKGGEEPAREARPEAREEEAAGGEEQASGGTAAGGEKTTKEQKREKQAKGQKGGFDANHSMLSCDPNLSVPLPTCISYRIPLRNPSKTKSLDAFSN